MESDDPLENVRWWSDEARASTTARNDWIVAARAAGHSLRVIAEAAGLSAEAVRRILNKA